MSGTPHDDGPPAKKGGAPAWMISFADVVSLMLTFFVMLYSMSVIDAKRWKEIADALGRQYKPPVEEETMEQPKSRYTISSVFRKRLVNLDYLHAVLEEMLANEPALNSLRLERRADNLVVVLAEPGLFQPGAAVLGRGARKTLFALGGVLSNIANPVAVVAHGDAAAVGGQAFSSNWELSVGRAAAVVNALREAGYTTDTTAVGRGQTVAPFPAVELIIQYGAREI